ncbi:MAG: type 4a pilus biogenesis protein PilO [Methylophilaceae bacterium]|nr:type 4a pilus biogenesis protein PilO [Methylophilaceae bacterium]
MKLEDFNNIDFNNAGNLPTPVKTVILSVIFVFLVAAGYWFFWAPALELLGQEKAKEQELREVFVTKKKQAVKLEDYKQQMIEIERIFGALLKQLPDKSQMDGLLTDINQAGLARGLEFELFKPGQETIFEFYAEMPISIKVNGNYHELGNFAADISKLSRIVTLNDLTITQQTKDSKDGKLVMEAIAKTYRYLDAGEIASKKKADQKDNKGKKN